MTSLEWTLLLTLWTGETVTLYTTQAGWRGRAMR